MVSSLGKRYLIHDRDPLFTEAVRGLLRDSGVKPLRLPANSPNLNAYAERFVLSIRRECLDRFVPLSERHLRTAVSEYVVHYHTERNHQGLTASSSSSTVVGTSFTSTPRSTRRLLGLFSNYARRFPTTPLRDISSSIAILSLTLRSSSSSRQRAQNPFALRFAAHGKTEPRSGGSAAAVASSLSTWWFSAHVISSGSCELTSATIMRTVATWG